MNVKGEIDFINLKENGIEYTMPTECWCTNPTDETTIKVKYGESGYYKSDSYTYDDPDTLNELFGITKAQKKAMRAGSIYGWDTPASKPYRYDEKGNVK